MLEKSHRGQAILWVIVIIAIVVLLFLWLSKKPASVSTTAPLTEENTSITVTPSVSITTTPTQSLTEIGKHLQDLNTSSTDLDKSLNDSSLDVNQ